jgi:acetyl esterase/lipase
MEDDMRHGGAIGNKSLARWKRLLSLRAYGVVTSTLFRATTPPQIMRARFERFGAVSRASLQRKFPNLAFDDHSIGPLAMESVRAIAEPRCAILHLHGGAFVMGSRASYRNRAMRLSYRCNAEVFVPDYRLAPEHPYPAALDDALVAWQYVEALRRGLPIFISGDSAGGGLALSLLLRLRALGSTVPNGAILLSPWTDLTTSGASIERNRHRDLWLSRKHLECWARYYVAQADPCTSDLSPVFADLSRLPPLLLLAGEHEVLLDDAVRIGEAAARAGTRAHVLIGSGMQHDWPLTLPWLDESRTAWSEIVRFVERHQASRTVHTPLRTRDAWEDAGTIERSANSTRDVQNSDLVSSR